MESADPELVAYFKYLADEDGWAHTMQRLPQGGAYWIKHKPEQLRECVRWLVNDPRMKAFGMALPSTCGPEGYALEKQKGSVLEVDAGASTTFDVEAGLLAEDEADSTEAHINAILRI